MLIRTKYNPGDKVWVLHDNQVQQRTVQSLRAYAGQLGKHENEYYLGLKGANKWEMWHNESRLYKEKKDLLAAV